MLNILGRYCETLGQANPSFWRVFCLCLTFQQLVTMGLCLCSGEYVKQPGKILRDTGAGQSFILEGVLPLSDISAAGYSVLVQVCHGVEPSLLVKGV
ncbi:unnamed protein product, partial [Coregonus sp. 'balchen']